MQMSILTRPVVVLVVLSLLGFLTHLIPHDMGITTVGAIGMLSAAYLPRHLVGFPVLISVLFVDAVHGFYAVLAMGLVCFAHIGAAYVGRPIFRRVTPITVVGAAIASALVFYLISNLAPMAMGFYPATPTGWITCYLNAIPFLMRGILANLLFGGAVFGVIWLVRGNGAHRIPAAQCH